MDYLAHGLWSYILFHKIKKVWYAVFFGLLPDNLSWVIYAVYNLIILGTNFGRPNLNEIPDWVYLLYGISHSLIIASVVIFLVYIITKKFLIYMLAWPAAIIMDIFSHSREFLPTPFLWPVSDWKFPGISWGNNYFMAINYTLIIGFLIYIYFNSKRTGIRKKR